MNSRGESPDEINIISAISSLVSVAGVNPHSCTAVRNLVLNSTLQEREGRMRQFRRIPILRCEGLSSHCGGWHLGMLGRRQTVKGERLKFSRRVTLTFGDSP